MNLHFNKIIIISGKVSQAKIVYVYYAYIYLFKVGFRKDAVVMFLLITMMIFDTF